MAKRCALPLLLVVAILVSGCDFTINLNVPFTTATPTAASQAVQQPSAIPVASATSSTIRVKLFFIALNDNGKSGQRIGCGDSVVFRERDIPRTDSPLRDTLMLLFSAKQQYYGTSRLYNALYQSNLKVDGISAHEGVFRVDLSGTVRLGGVCDNPRFEAQIKETIMQFPTVKQANVLINGTPLEKILSGAGG